MARPVGSRGKNTAFLMKRLEDMYGKEFHPIMRAAELADRLHKIAEETREPADIKAAIDAWDKIAAYTAPKLRSVEITGDEDRPLAVDHVIEFVGVE